MNYTAISLFPFTKFIVYILMVTKAVSPKRHGAETGKGRQVKVGKETTGRADVSS